MSCTDPDTETDTYIKLLGDGHRTVAKDILSRTEGGRFFVLGTTFFDNDSSQIVIYDVDESGNQLNSSQLAILRNTESEKLARSTDGGVYIIGHTYSLAGSGRQSILAKLSPELEALWGDHFGLGDKRQHLRPRCA
ncbi:MAG: hypothetical protein HC842_08475 [Cytophagales bacterium]|nr:hypothetical protein [Cytophagales bacterium]